MLLDKETLFADTLAYGGTPETLDLDAVRPGPGQPIKCFFLAETVLTACTGFTILDASVAPADEPLIAITPIPVTGEIYEFTIPSQCLQFVTMRLDGTASAGTFSCGIIVDAQTAM